MTDCPAPLRLPAGLATDVFVNEDGTITIKQPDPLGDEPMIVELTPEYAREVAAHLFQCANYLEAKAEADAEGAE